MRSSDLLILAIAAGAAWYMIEKAKASRGAGTVPGSSVSSWVNEIFNTTGGGFSNGWRYFDNGVAIDPDGNYYANGARVWSSPVSI